MRRLDRQPAPDFWQDCVDNWGDKYFAALAKPGATKPQVKRELHRKRPDGRSLALWFHATVRSQGSAICCAYCDGRLGETSAETIDHFVPESACWMLALTWENLYPACSACNSTHKGSKVVPELLRPDIDPVDEWLEIEWDTGTLIPHPRLDAQPEVRRRIERTIDVLQLNNKHRKLARHEVAMSLHRADNWAKAAAIRSRLLENGPYPFVAELWLAHRAPDPDEMA